MSRGNFFPAPLAMLFNVILSSQDVVLQTLRKTALCLGNFTINVRSLHLKHCKWTRSYRRERVASFNHYSLKDLSKKNSVSGLWDVYYDDVYMCIMMMYTGVLWWCIQLTSRIKDVRLHKRLNTLQVSRTVNESLIIGNWYHTKQHN